MRHFTKHALTAVICGFLVTSAAASSVLASGEVVAKVSIANQTMQVSVDGIAMYHWSVSTASAENTDCTRGTCKTPTGTFHPKVLALHGYSRKFKVPMPHAVFFDDEGNAVHAATPGEISELGKPASHGCIRLSPEHATIFFDLARGRPYTETTIRISEN